MLLPFRGKIELQVPGMRTALFPRLLYAPGVVGDFLVSLLLLCSFVNRVKASVENATLFPPPGIHVWEVWGNTNNETALFVLQSITSAGMNYASRVS